MSVDATITLAEVERFIRRMPGSHPEAGHALRDRQRRHTASGETLGRLTEIAFWMASWQNRTPPTMNRTRVVVFGATHGVDVGLAPSADIVDATARRILSLQDDDAPVARLCRMMGADLRVYNLSVDHPTDPFTDGPAMDDATCARAVVRGMMAVEEGLDLLCVGDVGTANRTSAAAMSTALFGGGASDWLESRPGEDANDLARRTAAVAEGLATNRPAMTDPLQVLRCLGGRDMAAIVGAIVAARFAGTPVLLDGFVSTAAAGVLWALDRHNVDHCLAAHFSSEPAHRRLLDKIERDAILDLDIGAGEATGAAVAMAVVRAAVECHAVPGSETSADPAAESGSEASDIPEPLVMDAKEPMSSE
ncbi:MAG: nicotinate-nucleotide--dimethylbenzimidazole phosphoribosyltransferase [Inquilinaceae bacterium]